MTRLSLNLIKVITVVADSMAEISVFPYHMIPPANTTNDKGIYFIRINVRLELNSLNFVLTHLLLKSHMTAYFLLALFLLICKEFSISCCNNWSPLAEDDDNVCYCCNFC